ncbi:hypothetical protein LEP1GSC073_2462 [Leptospira noguchii str. Cascata]|uniref:Uncharacterized protein n=3 Tax=Leptospira noguchii TaxID=28182 RepID=M6YGL2_9LEPT|nr:hypothetical protein LEP1GSC035_2028 [Leptospira noguchii str. 2007001578]EMO52857.1 hypothetical protein LEP1GSC172_3117 [Leptospira noguchii]EMO90966.1 hypothetical protein LEP1GSC024_4981 [Leptospira noguchii str. 2001034031]EMS87037.1 hypothetical protein LEP1GSC073_2462 [Leptospira noguchii str. Cascata]
MSSDFLGGVSRIGNISNWAFFPERNLSAFLQVEQFLYS